MGLFAKIINKGGSDKIVIPNVRTAARAGFQAPNWTDLRVGWFVSATQSGADDTITGLSETITDSGSGLPIQDHFFIGVKDSSNKYPANAGTVFIGFTNLKGGGPGGFKGNSALVSSDSGIGTTNTNFWRPKNGDGDFYAGAIYDGWAERGTTTFGVTPHVVQNAGGAGGYATLLGMRMLRDTPNSQTITFQFKSGTNNGDILYSNTPTAAIIQSNLQSFPSTVQQLGPVQLSQVPTSFFIYWPFHNSRIRIHAWGFVGIGT